MKCLCNESKPARTFLFVWGKGFGNFERFINLFTQNNGLFQSFIVFILLNENMKNFRNDMFLYYNKVLATSIHIY